MCLLGGSSLDVNTIEGQIDLNTVLTMSVPEAEKKGVLYDIHPALTFMPILESVKFLYINNIRFLN